MKVMKDTEETGMNSIKFRESVKKIEGFWKGIIPRRATVNLKERREAIRGIQKLGGRSKIKKPT